MSLAIRACVASLAVCLLAPVALAQVTIYVDADATGGANNGTSWADAFTDLQSAFTVATGGDEVRVAQGTYAPTAPNGPRDVPFEIGPSVTLKGGYAGFGQPDPDTRDLVLHRTILSGDLNGDDESGGSNAENSYRVCDVIGTGVIIDGVTIERGHANGTLSATSVAAGLRSFFSPTVVDCTIRQNVASGDAASQTPRGTGAGGWGDGTYTRCRFEANVADEGAGFAVSNGVTRFIDSHFVGNTAQFGAGGLLAQVYSVGFGGGPTDVTVAGSSFLGNSVTFPGQRGGGVAITELGLPDDDFDPVNVRFENTQFVGNFAEGTGGALYDELRDIDGSTVMRGCVVARNSSTGAGGVQSLTPFVALANRLVMANTVAWGNTGADVSAIMASVEYSCIEGGYPGTGNISADPQLTNVQALLLDPNGCDGIPGTADDFIGLAPTSPCIDAGSNALVPADTLDLDGDLNTTEPLPFDIAGNPRFVDVPGLPDTGVGPAPVVDMGAVEADFAGKTWVDYAQGLAGTHGEPVLCGAGTLLPLDPLTLTLTNVLESTTAWLTFGTATLTAPFKGGILVPDINPPGFVLPLPTGPTGTIPIAETWPDLGVGGFSIFFQYWIQDPAGPVGFSASNAIEGVVP